MTMQEYIRQCFGENLRDRQDFGVRYLGQETNRRVWDAGRWISYERNDEDVNVYTWPRIGVFSFKEVSDHDANQEVSAPDVEDLL